MQEVPARELKSGEVYIGVLIALGIFVMLSQAIVFLSGTAYELIGFNRARINAQLLASEKIELLRNLSFDDVGTVGGLPPGPIAQQEVIIQNGLPYTIRTSVIYIDDVFDDQSPDDLTPNDYKRARVEVSWSGVGRGSARIVMATDIVPRGIEQTLGGGTLSILVFDSNGLPVPQADVTIAAPTTVPPVNITMQTNDNGRIVLPGAIACSSCYRITASKSGYSADRTYGVSEVANPTKPDLSVLVSLLTETSFVIDRVATITLSSTDTRENNFTLLPNQAFTMRGTKIIGTTSLDVPVYKYNQTVTTNSQGMITLNNIDWDNYTVSVATASARTISGSNPILPLVVAPNQTINLSISLAPKPTFSVLSLFTDAANNPIASVSARLVQGSVETTVSSGLIGTVDYGHAFFSGLTNGSATIEASVSGYQTVTTPVNITGNTFEHIILNQ